MTRHWAMSLFNEGMTTMTVDYSALTTRLSKAEVAAYRAQSKASRAPWASLTPGTTVFLVFLSSVGVILLLVFAGFAVAGVVSVVRGSGNLSLLVPGVLVLIVAALAVAGARRAIKLGNGPWARRARIARFARANGMRYSPVQKAPDYPGMIFQTGRDRVVIDRVTTTNDRPVDMGNFRCVRGPEGVRTTHTWGYIALQLDRKLPNIVLDPKAKTTILGSSLPGALDKSQVLHLEGDFDRYFTLYCPADYERDALYIFTPDLMALLVDNAAPFAVELIDTWMLIYAPGMFDMTKPATLRRLFTIADKVGVKALHQTKNYADSKAGGFDANTVAPQGALLKRGVRVAVIVVLAIMLLLALLWAFAR